MVYTQYWNWQVLSWTRTTIFQLLKASAISTVLKEAVCLEEYLKAANVDVWLVGWIWRESSVCWERHWIGAIEGFLCLHLQEKLSELLDACRRFRASHSLFALQDNFKKKEKY